ncbi:molybdopterin dehydrogenase [Neorhizobium lilium]|uniref:Molybdopterin dehydrogenase n=1 Tax=Neorhizobium lilium TaxID=2503024 RepID=A0A444LL62_9HYPH|nr:FAD binding domain-containing protein [Neorhizobium lilium]RWX81074.1 molybdopterin dehydrogenase [Neorhizobium lilium]
MFDSMERSLTVAGSIEEALAAKHRGAAVLAGGTWLMRDPRRGVNLPDVLVSLHALPALFTVEIEKDQVVIGASVTHAGLARQLAGLNGFDAVVAAANGAANPAIRRVATVGGNLCTFDFAAADLLPVFLAMNAVVELRSIGERQVLPIAEFLANRRVFLRDSILTSVILRRDVIASAHARLPLRRAGDYPVAIVSAVRGHDGRVRIAVGSVEDVARRWISLEAVLAIEPASVSADPERMRALAAQCVDFRGRDGIEADGWYRCQVLPTLVRRAIASLSAKESVQ